LFRKLLRPAIAFRDTFTDCIGIAQGKISKSRHSCFSWCGDWIAGCASKKQNYKKGNVSHAIIFPNLLILLFAVIKKVNQSQASGLQLV
jgi:hypothetical protein